MKVIQYFKEGKTIFERDETGKVLSTVEQRFDEKTGKGIQSFKDANGKVTSTEEWIFDEKGNNTAVIIKDADGKVVGTDEYILNEDGTANEDPSVRLINHKDANGKLLGDTEFKKDENGNITSIFEDTFDENGNAIKTIIKDGIGRTVKSIELGYDEKGYIISEIHKDNAGKVMEIKEHSAFDTMGRPGRTLVKDAEGKVTVYEDDSDGKVVVKTGLKSLLSAAANKTPRLLKQRSGSER
ncbi:MAG: hypothetical protein E7021_02955 [Alphaproteobacteria bacterium]|nr:hypothetical protein [Alphaproteobacteria bacterium]